MKARDLTDLALRNLREAVFRNALTTLGVAVGVASLVAMLSLGVGLQQLASKRLSQSGLFDTIFVTPKNSFRGMGRPQREVQPDKPPRALDADARKEIEKLPNIIEVYPQVRFFTEVRFNNKPYATVVAGMPDSSKNSGSFDGMQGRFFSSPTANEAILQVEFAKDLSEKPDSILGQDLILRYAERQALASSATDPPGSPGEPSGGFSVVPKELRLKIVGVVETEPAAGYGGYGNARLLMPLETAATLRAAQVNDLRDIVRDTSANKTTYPSLSVRAKSPSQVDALEVLHQGPGLQHLLSSGRVQIPPHIFLSLRLASRYIWQPRTGRRYARDRQHIGYGYPRAPSRNWCTKGSWRRRFRRPAALLCGSRGHGFLRRNSWRVIRLAPRSGTHVRHQRLSPPPKS